MSLKTFNKLAVGSVTLTAMLAGAQAVHAGTLKLTPEQTQSFGPRQTDYTTTLTFNKFHEITDPVLEPNEMFDSFNSVHIEADITGISGAGSILCINAGPTGRCTGTFSSSLTGTLLVDGMTLGATVLSLVPTTPYSLVSGEQLTLTQTTNTELINYSVDLKEAIGDPAILAKFGDMGGTVDLTFVADGANNFNTSSGFAAFGNPITASVEAKLYYDYYAEVKQEPPLGTPEPSSILGLLAIGGLGLGLKRKKQS